MCLRLAILDSRMCGCDSLDYFWEFAASQTDRRARFTSETDRRTSPIWQHSASSVLRPSRQCRALSKALLRSPKYAVQCLPL